MDCMPRQTPNIGISAAKRGMSGKQTPASFGVQGPGDKMMASGRRSAISVERNLVVAHHVEHRTQLAQEMDKIVGETVIVIDDEHVHTDGPWREFRHYWPMRASPA